MYKLVDKEIIMYLIFGVLTTLVNIIVFYITSDLFMVATIPSNIIAWILSVLFAYVTNRCFVFSSKGDIKKELLSFFSVRLLSLVIDTIIVYIGIDVLMFDPLVVKIASNIVVVIANYIFSKFLVFKK